MAEDPLFERLAIIGLGLIGSSIGHVAKRQNLARRVAGCARTQATRDAALETGFVDSVTADPAEVVAGADLVMLCTPVGVFGALAQAFGPALLPGTIVTDAGSVKGVMFRDVAPHMPEGVHLIPGHPLSGTEHSGPHAGFAGLFENRWTILTPARDADPAALAKLTEFWTRAGAMVDTMEAEHHDLVLAIVSHVPHLIAYNIVGTADDLETVSKQEVIKYSAAGFRDFTRIAASDPVMWRDVFLTNREAVLEMLGRFSEDLTALQRAIRWGDGAALEALFARTRAIRRSIVDAKQHEYYYGEPEANHFFDGGTSEGTESSGNGPK